MHSSYEKQKHIFAQVPRGLMASNVNYGAVEAAIFFIRWKEKQRLYMDSYV